VGNGVSLQNPTIAERDRCRVDAFFKWVRLRLGKSLKSFEPPILFDWQMGDYW
jgi:hypothetical protein